MDHPIPRQSAKALQAYLGRSPQNPSLLFDRFGPLLSKDDDRLKKEWLIQVRDAAGKSEVRLLEAWRRRWEAACKSCGAEPFRMRTDWRFVTGLGRKGPLEVGFTFSRYGFPMLPGSSVKGVARAYAVLAAGVSETDDDFIAVFGRAPQPGEDLSVARAGGAVFFDAIPAARARLELDIMNPHYPKYYQGTEPPANWQSPVPVYFLTVAPGTEFCFAVGWRRPGGEEPTRLQALAKRWLIGGLTELGAGAKTTAGYGFFEQVVAEIFGEGEPGSSATPSPDPDQAPVESFRRRLSDMPNHKVASEIPAVVSDWQTLQIGAQAKRVIAQAILDKIEEAGRTKKSSEKQWFKELQTFLAEHPPG